MGIIKGFAVVGQHGLYAHQRDLTKFADAGISCKHEAHMTAQHNQIAEVNRHTSSALVATWQTAVKAAARSGSAAGVPAASAVTSALAAATATAVTIRFEASDLQCTPQASSCYYM